MALKDSKIMDTNTDSSLSVLGSDMSDRYTESIELSNACRKFYLNRVKTTQKLKDDVLEEDNVCLSSCTSPMESALHTLRQEMASLMEQDVSLMKQLLILNENIEEIKCKRLSSLDVSTDSICASSDSDLAFTRNRQSDKLLTKRSKGGLEKLTYCNKTKSKDENKSVSKPLTDHYLTPTSCYLQCGQNSVDSGYDDSEHFHSEPEIE